MVGEVTLSGEGLFTTWDSAGEWLFPRMNSQMGLKVPLLCEGLLAQGTEERFLTSLI